MNIDSCCLFFFFLRNFCCCCFKNYTIQLPLFWPHITYIILISFYAQLMELGIYGERQHQDCSQTQHTIHLSTNGPKLSYSSCGRKCHLLVLHQGRKRQQLWESTIISLIIRICRLLSIRGWSLWWPEPELEGWALMVAWKLFVELCTTYTNVSQNWNSLNSCICFLWRECAIFTWHYDLVRKRDIM